MVWCGPPGEQGHSWGGGGGGGDCPPGHVGPSQDLAITMTVQSRSIEVSNLAKKQYTQTQ